MFQLQLVRRTRSPWWRDLEPLSLQILRQRENPPSVPLASDLPPPWRRWPSSLLSRPIQSQRGWLWLMLRRLYAAEQQRLWWQSRLHLPLGWSLVCRCWRSRGSVGGVMVRMFIWLHIWSYPSVHSHDPNLCVSSFSYVWCSSRLHSHVVVKKTSWGLTCPFPHHHHLLWNAGGQERQTGQPRCHHRILGRWPESQSRSCSQRSAK